MAVPDVEAACVTRRRSGGQVGDILVGKVPRLPPGPWPRDDQARDDDQGRDAQDTATRWTGRHAQPFFVAPERTCLDRREGVDFLRFLYGFLSACERSQSRIGVPGMSKSSRSPFTR